MRGEDRIDSKMESNPSYPLHACYIPIVVKKRRAIG